MPVLGSSLTTSWSGSGRRDVLKKPILGGRLKTSRSSVLGDRQALAGAQEERNAGPAPIVHLQTHRCVCLGRRIGGYAVHLSVAVVLGADVMGGVGRGHC